MWSDRLSPLRTWALYYGDVQEPGLAEYDLVIVAPEAWDREAVARLQRRGTLVIGYLSVLEVPKRAGEPPPPHVLMVEGEPAQQTRWNNWILDPRAERARSHVAERARSMADCNFDGFFMDTLGDVESAHIPLLLRSRLLPATAQLVGLLRKRYPDRLLIQNWGLGALLDLTVPFLDAVCWEDFPDGPPQAWEQSLADRLTGFAQQGLTVLALGTRQSERAPRWAGQLGFPWYGAPGSYTRLAGRSGA